MKKKLKLLNLMKMQTLSDLNALYNFQDTVILCEIFENRAGSMNKKFKFNPAKCSSASTLSGATHTHVCQAIISFPTNIEIERTKQLDAINSIKNKKRKNHQRDDPKEVDELLEDLEGLKNTKMIYEFHPQDTATVKALGVKKQDIAKPSTRFFCR